MFYKEWLLTRQKLLLMAILYGVAAILVGTTLAPGPETVFPSPLFQTWLLIVLATTVISAPLGGVDAIAEETDKGTIGFLLTRPLSRTKIYLALVKKSGDYTHLHF